MPDNSADYDEPDDLSADNDDDPDTHQGLVWNLLLLINPGDEENRAAPVRCLSRERLRDRRR